MSELNIEQVKKELVLFIDDMPVELHFSHKKTAKFSSFLKHILTVIEMLEYRLKECENGYEGTLHLERCKLHDAEEKIEELAAQNDRLFARNLELSENGEKVVIAYKKLSEENERLKRHVNRLKKYDEERDIALHARLIRESKADTVREVQDKAKAKAFPEDGCGNECIYMTDLVQIIKQISEGV